MNSGAAKRGRPANPPARLLNVCTVSLEGLASKAAAIQSLLKTDSYEPLFSALDDLQRGELSKQLAYEVACYPALAGLVTQTKNDRPGPKRKGDHIAFVSTVRDKLSVYGVALPQWSNGRSSRDDLLTFCTDLASVGDALKMNISERSARTLTDKGFTSE